MTSVNTNYGALVALQSLSQTTRELDMVQSRVNTGLKVASAKDNGAVFAIAEGQRTRVASLGAVRDGIDRATSAIDVGLSAGEAIGDILKQMKEKAVAAQATDLSTDQRAALQSDFDAMLDQIDQIAGAATFNGANLVNGTNLTAGGNAMRVLTTDGAGSGGSSAAGQFTRGAAADGTVVGSSLSLTTDITSATVAGGTGQGLDALDTIDIAVGTTTYQVGITAGDTLGDVIDNINTATNGRVVASFDEDTGQVLYTSQESFTVTVADDATTDAAAEVEALFNGTSIGYVGGGGYQRSGGALATAASLSETLGSIGAAVAGNNDVLTLTLFGGDAAVGGGDDRTFQITLDANSTLAEFVAQVSDTTGGEVTALYDETTGTLTYRSDEDFTVALSNNGVTGTFFGTAANTSSGGTLAPSGAGGAGGSTNQMTLSGFDFRLGKAGQALATVTSSLNVSTTAGGEAASAAIDSALTSLNGALATLGAQSKALTVQKTFLGKLSDSIEAGISNLVDADLAKESARLQSLQVKQQLGAQALSIANSAPSIVLSFFR
jgi:flagellin